jgi:hypothetical protein
MSQSRNRFPESSTGLSWIFHRDSSEDNNGKVVGNNGRLQADADSLSVEMSPGSVSQVLADTCLVFISDQAAFLEHEERKQLRCGGSRVQPTANSLFATQSRACHFAAGILCFPRLAKSVLCSFVTLCRGLLVPFNGGISICSNAGSVFRECDQSA